MAPTAGSTWLYLAPLLISATLPCNKNDLALASWPIRCITKYFNYSEVKEIDDAELLKYIENRPTMLVCCPHGEAF